MSDDKFIESFSSELTDRFHGRLFERSDDPWREVFQREKTSLD